MAQKRKPLRRRVSSLAKRYGLVGRGGIVAACVVLVVALAGVGVARMNTAPAMMLERSENDANVGISQDSTSAEEKNAHTDSDDAGEGQKNTASDAPNAEAQKPSHVVVHVDGAVANPGVYEITKDEPRVVDAVGQAGGLAGDADTSSLNLASPLQDGQKVHVPHEGEELATTSGESESAVPPSPDARAAPAQPSLININSATAEELQALPGVGVATAAAIVEDRETHGAFTSPEDLMRVSGIGEKRFAKMKDMVCV